MANMEYVTKYVANLSDPSVWGPSKWFDLHVSAANYPLNASPIVAERMKNRILALPYEVPCYECKIHASSFVEANKGRLDEICSGRRKLVEFYVQFHNQVNKRYGKREWTVEEAEKYYSGGGYVTYLKYS